jgi:hypothetical protein
MPLAYDRARWPGPRAAHDRPQPITDRLHHHGLIVGQLVGNRVNLGPWAVKPLPHPHPPARSNPAEAFSPGDIVALNAWTQGARSPESGRLGPRKRVSIRTLSPTCTRVTLSQPQPPHPIPRVPDRDVESWQSHRCDRGLGIHQKQLHIAGADDHIAYSGRAPSGAQATPGSGMSS